MGGRHIGSSRMEQSYCTSGFFRQRANARNHSNYQPTPKRRSIIAYGNRENARRDKCIAVCVICFIFIFIFIFFFFFCCSVLHVRFPNVPGKGTAIFPFFVFVLFCFCFLFYFLFLKFFPVVLSAVTDMSDPLRYPEHLLIFNYLKWNLRA